MQREELIYSYKIGAYILYQLIRILRNTGIVEVSRRIGQDIQQVFCPEDVTKYHQNIDGVEQGNQLRDHGVGFSYKAQFNKWYRHGHLGLCNFGLLNSRIYWNVSCKQMVVSGVKMWDPPKKWQFSAILDEELINFTDVFDSDNTTDLNSAMLLILGKIDQGNFPTTNIDTVRFVRSAICLRLSCNVCFIEKIGKQSLKIKTTSQLYKKMKEMVYYNECHMDETMSVKTASVLQVTGLENLTCFEIMYIKDIDNLWN